MKSEDKKKNKRVLKKIIVFCVGISLCLWIVHLFFSETGEPVKGTRGIDVLSAEETKNSYFILPGDPGRVESNGRLILWTWDNGIIDNAESSEYQYVSMCTVPEPLTVLGKEEGISLEYGRIRIVDCGNVGKKIIVVTSASGTMRVQEPNTDFAISLQYDGNLEISVFNGTVRYYFGEESYDVVAGQTLDNASGQINMLPTNVAVKENWNGISASVNARITERYGMPRNYRKSEIIEAWFDEMNDGSAEQISATFDNKPTIL